MTPVRVNERRSSYGYISGGGNQLVQAAQPNRERKWIPPLENDFHRNINSYGRRSLMNLGRWIFWNFPAVRGAILEQANLAVSTFIPQSQARDSGWANAAEQWLREWHRIMDVAGWPHDYQSYVQLQITASLVDGDTATLLVENESGYPLIQNIPAHRIDSGSDSNLVEGCRLDDFGRVISYRIWNGMDARDIPAANMALCFDPIAAGQVRGISALAVAAFDFQDVQEFRRFEMLAQKAFSTQTIVETNESGDADEAQKIIQTAATYTSAGKLDTPAQQMLDGGTIRYLRANSGSKLESFDWNRPNQNTQAFQETLIRDAFRGTEWDSFFSLDPKSIGGAPLRVIVEKVNAVLGKRRRMVEKICRRIDGYAISKAIKLGLLPENEDWWRWEYQGPQEVTADRKYDAEVDHSDIAQGLSTRRRSIARRGQYIEDVDAQREREVDSDLTRAGRLAKKHGITIQEAIVLLRPPTPNQQLPQTAQPATTSTEE